MVLSRRAVILVTMAMLGNAIILFPRLDLLATAGIRRGGRKGGKKGKVEGMARILVMEEGERRGRRRRRLLLFILIIIDIYRNKCLQK